MEIRSYDLHNGNFMWFTSYLHAISTIRFTYKMRCVLSHFHMRILLKGHHTQII